MYFQPGGKKGAQEVSRALAGIVQMLAVSQQQGRFVDAKDLKVKREVNAFHLSLVTALQKEIIGLSDDLYRYKALAPLWFSGVVDVLAMDELLSWISHHELLALIRDQKMLTTTLSDVDMKRQVASRIDALSRCITRESLSRLSSSDVRALNQFLTKHLWLSENTGDFGGQHSERRQALRALLHDFSGYDTYRIGNDVQLKITFMGDDFKKKDLEGCTQFSRKNPGKITILPKEDGLMLDFLHLKRVSIDCQLYGFTGEATFDVAMSVEFKWYDFLKNFSDKRPLHNH